MRIVLLGAPGSGKGTQAQLLMDKFQCPQISTGDLLRAAVAAGTPLGMQAKAAIDAGQLVSDEIVLAMIRERLTHADAKGGFILDGFPRNIPQAEALDRMLEKMHQPVDLAILVEVDFDALMQRLTGRRTCESCGAVFNVYTSPSKLDDQCDKCGGNLRRRADDVEETIANRLKVYEAQTEPVIAYYRGQGKLRVVQGIGEIPDIFAAMEKAIQDAIAAQKAVDVEAIPETTPDASAAPPPRKGAITMEDLQSRVMSAIRSAEEAKTPKPSKPMRPIRRPKPAAKAGEAAKAKGTEEAGKATTKKAAAESTSKKTKGATPATTKTKKAAGAKGTGKAPVKAKKKAAAKAPAKKKVAKKTPVKKAAKKKATPSKVAKKKAPLKKKVAIPRKPAKSAGKAAKSAGKPAKKKAKKK